MKRTPLDRTMGIALTSEQYSLLKKYSAVTNKSISCLIRESLDWSAIMSAIIGTRAPDQKNLLFPTPTEITK